MILVLCLKGVGTAETISRAAGLAGSGPPAAADAAGHVAQRVAARADRGHAFIGYVIVAAHGDVKRAFGRGREIETCLAAHRLLHIVDFAVLMEAYGGPVQGASAA